jgi:hypothetical protein
MFTEKDEHRTSNKKKDEGIKATLNVEPLPAPLNSSKKTSGANLTGEPLNPEPFNSEPLNPNVYRKR